MEHSLKINISWSTDGPAGVVESVHQELQEHGERKALEMYEEGLTSGEITYIDSENFVEYIGQFNVTSELVKLSLLKQYRDLEMTVLNSLRELIENSDYESSHSQYKAIKVDIFALGYMELAIIHDKLTFVDKHGMHYSVFNEVTLEDLIKILEKQLKY